MYRTINIMATDREHKKEISDTIVTKAPSKSIIVTFWCIYRRRSIGYEGRLVLCILPGTHFNGNLQVNNQHVFS